MTTFPRRLLFVCLAVFLAVPLCAESPHLVTDLASRVTGAASSQPSFAGSAGSYAYFSARSPQWVLYASDGTAAGTTALFDSYMEVRDFKTSAQYAFVMGWPQVQRGDAGIWRLDGTKGGTRMLLAPDPTAPGPSRRLLVGLGPKILTVENGLRDVWSYDDSGGTKLFELGTNYAWRFAAVAGGLAYIGTRNGLWRTDGTVAGTVQLSTMPAYRLTTLGNRLYFVSWDTDGSSKLWTSDGTAGGTRMVAGLGLGDYAPYVMAAVGQKLFYIGVDGQIGVSDGTASGTRILLTTTKPGKDYVEGVSYIADVNGVAIFTFDDGTHGPASWRSDGTVAGTRMVSDVPAMQPVVGARTHAYFASADFASVMVTDGTAAGTRVLAPNRGGAILDATVVGNLFFYSYSDPTYGLEPWVTDGTPAGTRLIANLAPEAAGSSYPSSLTAGDDRLFFIARGDDAYGVWTSDGTAAGTRVAVTSARSEWRTFGANGNSIYYTDDGQKLWKSDGGATPPVLLREFATSLVDMTPITFVGGRGYFVAGGKCWVTDDTPQGTVALADASPGFPIVVFGGHPHLFWANGSLYSLGATAAETRLVAKPAEALTFAKPPIVVRGALYAFGATSTETVLYRYSGGAGEATPVIRLGVVLSGLEAAAAGDTLLFLAADRATNNEQLWRSDGTAAGTTLLRSFTSSVFPPTKRQLVSIGSRVIFSAGDAVHGFEPWVSDGTASGTFLLRDIAGGTADSDLTGLTNIEGVAYFAATDAEHGKEPWRSDGTPGGTQLVGDVEAGPGSSSPGGFVRVRDQLFFSAANTATGRELWAYALGDTPAVTSDDAAAANGATSATLTVRLTRASSRRISVRYQTADDRAKAGADYTAASGTLDFARGETVKTIALTLTGKKAQARAFLVRFETNDLPVERPVAAVIIEGTSGDADLAVSLTPTATGDPVLTVKNNGPAAASNVTLCTAMAPSQPTLQCDDGTRQLAAGESFDRRLPLISQQTIVARVTAAEHDPDTANNAGSWLANSGLILSPASIHAGKLATITIGTAASTPPATYRVTSSDQQVLQASLALSASPGQASASGTVTAINEGLATITVTGGPQPMTLRVQVGRANDSRFVPLLQATNALPSPMLGVPSTRYVAVVGITSEGKTPGGVVSLYEERNVIAQSPLIGGVATLTFSPTAPGYRGYAIAYSGDANFAAATTGYDMVMVGLGTVSFRAIAGSNGSATILASGVNGHPPSGTITISDGGATRPAAGPLAAISWSVSSTTVTSVPDTARTITINYSGEGWYDGGSVTIPVERPRRRADAH